MRTGVEFEQLVNRHKDAVYRQMVRVCGNQADAEDVLQDALLNAYRALGTLRDREAFQAWLARIGRNVCFRLKKKEALRPILDLPDPGGLDSVESQQPSAEAQVVRQDIDRCVKAALERLPDTYRRVLELRDIEGHTAPDAARILGIGVPALKSRLHRARGLLRAELDSCFR
jgi:RNA polymerase sigma-70 factor, ECF subfamily